MSIPILYPEAGDTVPIPFTTYGGTNGESITCSGLAVTDIEIYKDGSTTQRASDAGYSLLDTDGIDFDGITGLHGFSIDLSDDTDAGFYEVGSWYWVVVSAITVDSQTVSFIAAMFRIVSTTRGLAGADSVTITITVGGLPVADADVWISTDASGANVVAGTVQTDSNGQYTFALDAGNTYYLWAQKDGYNLPYGVSFVAAAD